MKTVTFFLLCFVCLNVNAQDKSTLIKQINELLQPIVGQNDKANKNVTYTKAEFKEFINDFIGFDIQTTNKNGTAILYTYYFKRKSILGLYEFEKSTEGTLSYLSIVSESAFEAQKLAKEELNAVRFSRTILHIPFLKNAANAQLFAEKLKLFTDL